MPNPTATATKDAQPAGVDAAALSVDFEDNGKTFEPSPQVDAEDAYVIELTRISQARWEPKKGQGGVIVLDPATGKPELVLMAWFNFKAICDLTGDTNQEGRECSTKINVKAFFGENSKLRQLFVAMLGKEPKECKGMPLTALIGQRCRADITCSYDDQGEVSRAWANKLSELKGALKTKYAISSTAGVTAVETSGDEDSPF